MSDYEKHRKKYNNFVTDLPDHFAERRGGIETIWDQALADSWSRDYSLEKTVDAFKGQKKLKDFEDFLEDYFQKTAGQYNPADYEPDFGN